MTWRDDAERDARDAYPREACGLVVVARGREIYHPCRNVAAGVQHFEIDPADYAEAEDSGTIVGVFHSHPDGTEAASEPDRVGCESSGVPWHILAWPENRWGTIVPSGYAAPLIGREFHHGTLDCYGLIRDWYRIERGVVLSDFQRLNDWWHQGGDLYRAHFAEAGFEAGADLHPGAVLLMQVASPVPNHAAIYLGDDIILHHLHGRLSSRDVYGGFWRKVTTHVLRYVGS